MLTDDIKTIDSSFKYICHPEKVIDSWYRIKEALTKVENASTNPGSPKLPLWEDNKESFIEYLWEIGAGGIKDDVVFMAEMYHEFLERQLRADA